MRPALQTALLVPSRAFGWFNFDFSTVSITQSNATLTNKTQFSATFTDNGSNSTHHAYGMPAGFTQLNNEVFEVQMTAKMNTLRYLALRGDLYISGQVPWVAIDLQTGVLNGNGVTTNEYSILNVDGSWTFGFRYVGGTSASTNLVIAGDSNNTAPGQAASVGDTYTGSTQSADLSNLRVRRV